MHKNRDLLKIIEIGIILESPGSKSFRYVTFMDVKSKDESKYMVFRANQPYLWKNIEKAEKNPKEKYTLPGKIETYNGIDIVIFEGESEKEAYEKQKWKIKEQKKISRAKAMKQIAASQGYITEKNFGESITPNWYPLEEDEKKIKFRYYHKSDINNISNHSYFEWTDWFEIYD